MYKNGVICKNIFFCKILFFQEVKEVYEGEATELTPVETENPHGGYGKTISHIIIGLKTTKGSKSLKLDPTIYENIQKEKIQVKNKKNNPVGF